MDLTNFRLTIRDPNLPKIFEAVHEVSGKEAVVSAEKVPFERKMVRTRIITQQPSDFYYRDVLVHPHNIKTYSLFVLEDTISSVGEDGIVT